MLFISYDEYWNLVLENYIESRMTRFTFPFSEYYCHDTVGGKGIKALK